MFKQPRRAHKPRLVPKAHANDVLALVGRHIRSFNAHAWRASVPPPNGQIIVEPPRDGYGPKIRIRDGDAEIIVSLQPGTQIVEREGSTLSPATLHALPQTCVKAICRRPLRKDAPITPKMRNLEWPSMSPVETAQLREIVGDMITITPVTAQPIIHHAGMRLFVFDDDPCAVALEFENPPLGLLVLILEAPGWAPWHAGTWTAPPPQGCRATYGVLRGVA